MVFSKVAVLLYELLELRPWQRIKAISFYDVTNSPAVTEIAELELCCVCLSQLKEGGDGTRLLPCLHRFHEVCIERWLSMCRPKTCPVCRFSMAAEERAQKKDELTEEMVIWFSSFHVAGF